MQWITRERPKIDRVACPWLIRRFIDTRAELLFVPPAEVRETARRTGASQCSRYRIDTREVAMRGMKPMDATTTSGRSVVSAMMNTT